MAPYGRQRPIMCKNMQQMQAICNKWQISAKTSKKSVKITAPRRRISAFSWKIS